MRKARSSLSVTSSPELRVESPTRPPPPGGGAAGAATADPLPAFLSPLPPPPLQPTPPPPPRRVEARPDAETQVDLVHVLLRDPGYGQEGAYPGPRAMTDLFQAGFHEEAVVAPQGDHVRHGAERHEVEILPQAGILPSGKRALFPQQAPDPAQQQENHAHPRDLLLRVRAILLLRVQDGISGGKDLCGDMVVRHDDVQSRRGGMPDRLHVGNPAIHGDDEPYAVRGGRLQVVLFSAVPVP